jgi:hypothetical protein
MNSLTIHLAADVEQKLRDQASRAGKSLETYVVDLAERAAKEHSANGVVKPIASVRPEDLSAEEWVAKFRAWVDSQPRRDVIADDSRESIYEGCGE